MIELATCTYQEFQPSMGAAVRTTVGAPRFPLTYPLAGWARLVTPTRAMLSLDRGPYRDAYLKRLEQTGWHRIHAELEQLTETARGRRLVLLCFDRLDQPGSWCHRTMLAEWLAEHTGSEVPELGAVPRPEPPPLFDL